MPTLSYSLTLPVPANVAWSVVGDLEGAVTWIPGLATAAMDGSSRYCTTMDGHEIREAITDYSDENRSYRYEHLVVPLPVRLSRGSFQVVPEAEGSTVLWQAQIEPADPSREAEITTMIDGYYRQTLAMLRRRIEEAAGVAAAGAPGS